MDDHTDDEEYSQYHVDHRPMNEIESPITVKTKSKGLKKSVP